LPIVSGFTTDANQQVRQAAIECLAETAKLLKEEDVEKHVLPIIQSLANDRSEEEHRVEAAEVDIFFFWDFFF